MNYKFLKNKSILITGGTGSIGSALVKYLVKTNCKVIRVMSNDENGLYNLSRDLNLTSFSFDTFSEEMKLNKIRFFFVKWTRKSIIWEKTDKNQRWNWRSS